MSTKLCVLLLVCSVTVSAAEFREVADVQELQTKVADWEAAGVVTVR
jgi:hypothetical protein